MIIEERQQRLEKVISYLVSIKQIEGKDIVKEISEKMDRHPNNIRAALRGEERYLTFKFAKTFCMVFGNIVSPDWIYEGDGTMLVNSSYKPTIKMLPSQWEEKAAIGYDRKIGKPYYNVDFEMGYDFMVNDQTTTPDYMIDFTPYNKCDCWCNAHGDSMRPTISSGDVIAIKEVRDFSYLINGEIYAIVTKNELRTIKRIKDNGETITLIPDNKDYSEQVIDKKNIEKVFKVLGSMKMF